VSLEQRRRSDAFAALLLLPLGVAAPVAAQPTHMSGAKRWARPRRRRSWNDGPRRRGSNVLTVSAAITERRIAPERSYGLRDAAASHSC